MEQRNSVDVPPLMMHNVVAERRGIGVLPLMMQKFEGERYLEN